MNMRRIFVVNFVVNLVVAKIDKVDDKVNDEVGLRAQPALGEETLR